MTINSIPIWLDCDPGHDDAIAMLISCFHPAFKLLGLGASYGNAPSENTSYNARSLITAFGKTQDVPIYPSAKRPWVFEPEYAPDVHGASGLDGTTLLPVPECEMIIEKSYLDAMEEAIITHNGEITLVSTGALTSVATLLRDRPHLKKMVRYISIMGGGIDLGNRNDNHSAEFNIWIDPQAANFILSDPDIKNKCILLPLNVTHKAIADQRVQDQIRGKGQSKLRELFYELFKFFEHCYKDAQGFDYPPTHDPLTLMPLLQFYGWVNPSVLQLTYRRLNLHAIEDRNSPDLGKTCILKEYNSQEDLGTIVCFDMNIGFFWEQVFQALDRAAKSSTIE
ncbi:trifunctional uridine nucleosidase/nicotinamide riboside hydrolase/nicotinic acid riboside hydrolase TDEL_0A03560 [Torulaspora delbrueckii]|uniref:Inosine/uridine-preferring nucleoside hydrolase domain-containing protein n=1 Tax=Torulaspora delbrueckii TaxID=4950 RepID=G8ZM44_TORDE|nr:hypothetical protein TDEL_0A03560 [Torulaspora delbrueckii]CCE89688.1 hypothetical protein TDEL_0A03560 [Torulaspora delbrueckii]